MPSKIGIVLFRGLLRKYSIYKVIKSNCYELYAIGAGTN